MDSNNGGLQVEWTREDVVSGVLRAIVDCEGLDAGALVSVTVDDDAIYSQPAQPKADGRVHLNLHTHLLDNGPHRIEVAVMTAGGPRSASASIHVRNEGLVAAQVAAALRAHAVPVVFQGDCDSSYYAAAKSSAGHWLDAPDAERMLDEHVASGRITPREAEQLRGFRRDGYVILDELLPEDLLLRANEALDQAVSQAWQGYRYGESTRLEQMHVHFPAIREIWLYPAVHRFLSIIFGVPSEPCQSLVYVFGSQQDAHQDTVHLTPFPAGLMCGVWIALEDVQAGSGELVVYPGSHKLPRVYMHDAGCAKVDGDWSEFGSKVVSRWSQMLQESGTQPVPYYAKRGQILIWHENLMHAGSVRRDPSLSRRSVVTHHFAQGAIAYYDSSGNVGHTHAVGA
jgi:hypothetical protein